MCARARKRPRKEQQTEEEVHEDLTAAATPKRRVIKLTSIKELRAEVTENAHKGTNRTLFSIISYATFCYLLVIHQLVSIIYNSK